LQRYRDIYIIDSYLTEIKNPVSHPRKWGFHSSSTLRPPGWSGGEIGRWVTLFTWPWNNEDYTPFLGRSIGLLSAGIGCLLEDEENNYRLISGYLGGIEFEGLQEVIHRMAP
jgi:hypothetical protein